MRIDGPAKPITGWRLVLLLFSAIPAIGILLSLTDPWWIGQLCVNWTVQGALALLPVLLLMGRRLWVGAVVTPLLVIAVLPWLRAAMEPNLPAPQHEAICASSPPTSRPATRSATRPSPPPWPARPPWSAWWSPP